MATQSNFLKMVLPQNNEFQDIWDQPLNNNLEKIDNFAKSFNDEIVAARFNKSSLKQFLEVSLNPDGTLKATSEVQDARNSFLYGDEGGNPVEDFTLKERLLQGDKEVHQAREGLPSLRKALANKSYLQNVVLEGSKNANGFPTWMGFTGSDVQVDGSNIEFQALIDGQLQRIRTLRQIDLSGESSGTYFIYAQFEKDGQVVVDGDANNPPPANANGTVGTDGTKLRIFEDLTTDFTTKDLVPGDLLDIIDDPQGNTGTYIIDEVAPGGNVNQLKIRGVFRGQSASSINYKVRNPWSPSLGFDSSMSPASGKLYIGEADFDGSSVTAVRALHFKDTFVGDWRSVDVSSNSNFEEIWDHNFLDTNLEFVAQVSQADDGSQPIEELSLSELSNTLGVDVTGNFNYSPGVFDPGSTDASYTQGSFSGSVSGNLTGSIENARSVRAKFTKNRIWVKNVIPNVFYKDYDGAVQQTGFIRIIVRKRV